MDLKFAPGEIKELKQILKDKKVKISIEEIKNKIGAIDDSQHVFPTEQQRALVLQLLHDYDKNKTHELIKAVGHLFIVV